MPDRCYPWKNVACAMSFHVLVSGNTVDFNALKYLIHLVGGICTLLEKQCSSVNFESVICAYTIL